MSDEAQAPASEAATCPVCQRNNLVLGKADSQFRPAKSGGLWKAMSNAPYYLSPLACLDCGHVGLYLTDKDLKRLRRQVSD